MWRVLCVLLAVFLVAGRWKWTDVSEVEKANKMKKDSGGPPEVE